MGAEEHIEGSFQIVSDKEGRYIIPNEDRIVRVGLHTSLDLLCLGFGILLGLDQLLLRFSSFFLCARFSSFEVTRDALLLGAGFDRLLREIGRDGADVFMLANIVEDVLEEQVLILSTLRTILPTRRISLFVCKSVYQMLKRPPSS